MEVGLPLLLSYQMVFQSPECTQFIIHPHSVPPDTHTCRHTHWIHADRPTSPLFHPPMHSHPHTRTRCHRVWWTDGSLAEVLSVHHVCLIYNQLTLSPMSSSVANTAPLTSPWTHIQTQQQVVMCAYLCVRSHLEHIKNQNSHFTANFGHLGPKTSKDCLMVKTWVQS